MSFHLNLKFILLFWIILISPKCYADPEYCDSISSTGIITVPESNTSLTDMYKGCSNLKEYVFTSSNKLTTIEATALKNTGITSNQID